MISQPELGGVCEVAHGVLVQLVAEVHGKLRSETSGCKLSGSCHRDECARSKAPVCFYSTHQTVANTCLNISLVFGASWTRQNVLQAPAKRHCRQYVAHIGLLLPRLCRS